MIVSTKALMVPFLELPVPRQWGPYPDLIWIPATPELTMSSIEKKHIDLFLLFSSCIHLFSHPRWARKRYISVIWGAESSTKTGITSFIACLHLWSIKPWPVQKNPVEEFRRGTGISISDICRNWRAGNEIGWEVGGFYGFLKREETEKRVGEKYFPGNWLFLIA